MYVPKYSRRRSKNNDGNLSINKTIVETGSCMEKEETNMFSMFHQVRQYCCSISKGHSLTLDFPPLYITLVYTELAIFFCLADTYRWVAIAVYIILCVFYETKCFQLTLHGLAKARLAKGI